MQFYLQSAVVEKGVKVKDYIYSRMDVIVGCIMTDVVAFFIIVACAATIYVTGNRDIKDAGDAAMALRPLAGHAASALFAVGLVNASLFSACILPLATAYYVCEGLGLESGINKRFSEAPAFYWLYTSLIFLGMLAVLLLSEDAAGSHHPALPGCQRHPAAFRRDLYAATHQPRRPHGTLQK